MSWMTNWNWMNLNLLRRVGQSLRQLPQPPQPLGQSRD
jgi:hypothetical protein